MRSKPLQEAYVRAEALDAKLRADDARLEGAVQVRHADGTVLFFDHAFAEAHPRDKADLKDREEAWWFIFTEHHGVHVYAQDEVVVRMYHWLSKEVNADRVACLERRLALARRWIPADKIEKYDEADDDFCGRWPT